MPSTAQICYRIPADEVCIIINPLRCLASSSYNVARLTGLFISSRKLCVVSCCLHMVCCLLRISANIFSFHLLIKRTRTPVTKLIVYCWVWPLLQLSGKQSSEKRSVFKVEVRFSVEARRKTVFLAQKVSTIGIHLRFTLVV